MNGRRRRHMTSSDAKDVSTLLRAWRDGDQNAIHELTPIVYEELRRLAHHYMRGERSGHSLQTSALVNEAYIRLTGYNRVQWRDRAHFFAVSSQVMRRILVDLARSRNLKRGAGARHIALDEAIALVAVPPRDCSREMHLAALDDAMNELARLDPRKVQIVEMRFFGGLTAEETAAVLRLSPATVRRDWRIAKLWLYRRINGGASEGTGGSTNDEL
jgi:RNA polymerase sigma factor (TIGR02999 family)